MAKFVPQSSRQPDWKNFRRKAVFLLAEKFPADIPCGRLGLPPHGSEARKHDAQSTASRNFGTVGRLAPAGAAAWLGGRVGVVEHRVAIAAAAERPLDGNPPALPGSLPVPGVDPVRTAGHPTGLSPRVP